MNELDDYRRKYPELADLLDSFLERADPIAQKTTELLRDIDTIRHSLTAEQRGLIAIDKHKDDVRRLVTNPERRHRFQTDLDAYEAAWKPVSYHARGHTHTDRVMQIVQNHPFIQRHSFLRAIPLAVMMDIANQSDAGIYQQQKQAVSPLTDSSSEFITLSHLDYWRKTMGKQAVAMGRRFAANKKPMDLIMVGDGSGELGSDMATALAQSHLFSRLVHIDVGDQMLQAQRTRYTQAGIPETDIVSIKGSITHPTTIPPEFLKQRGAFFVLHEIFDAVRTHALLSDPDTHSIRELYQLIDTSGKQPPSLQAFEPQSPLLQRLDQHLPFYRPSGKNKRHMPFSPHIPILMRNILASGDTVAMYTGDYAGQFLLGEAGAYSDLSMRIYGANLRDNDRHNYSLVFRQPVDMTADVLPSIVYLSELYGGRVDHLSSQKQFLAQVDPALPKRIPHELDRIAKRAQAKGYSRDTTNDLLQDSLFVTELCSPTMFAAVVTKGLK